MFQNYIQKSTQKVLQTLDIAVSEMAAMQQNLLTPDFILLALLSQRDSEAVKILEGLVHDHKAVIDRLVEQIHQQHQQAVPVKSSQVVASQEVNEVFRIADEEARSLGDDYIGTGTLFLALFDQRAGLTAKLLNDAPSRSRTPKAVRTRSNSTPRTSPRWPGPANWTR